MASHLNTGRTPAALSPKRRIKVNGAHILAAADPPAQVSRFLSRRPHQYTCAPTSNFLPLVLPMFIPKRRQQFSARLPLELPAIQFPVFSPICSLSRGRSTVAHEKTLAVRTTNGVFLILLLRRFSSESRGRKVRVVRRD